MADDLWLTCTLKFPGTYPPGGEGPGGGGTGGGKDDDEDDDPCNETYQYWACVSGGSPGAGENEGGQQGTGTAYCVPVTVNVDETDYADCDPPPMIDYGGETLYEDEALCMHYCEVPGGGGGAGGGLQGGGGGGSFGGPCKGRAYFCNPSSKACSTYWMEPTHYCFNKMFNPADCSLFGTGGQSVCTDPNDPNAETYYFYESACRAACAGGGGGCTYSFTVAPTAIDHLTVCIGQKDLKQFVITNTSQGNAGDCGSVTYDVSWNNSDWKLNPTNKVLSQGASAIIYVLFEPTGTGPQTCTITVTPSTGGATTVTATGTGSNSGNCCTCPDQPVWRCINGSCTDDLSTSTMACDHPCFNALFNPTTCTRITGASCTDTDGITWWNGPNECTNGPPACEPLCEGASLWCDDTNPFNPTCTLYWMPQTEYCFDFLFDKDNNCQRYNQAEPCTDSINYDPPRTFYTNNGNPNNKCAPNCQPDDPVACTRYKCTPPVNSGDCFADGTNWQGINACVESETVYCDGSNGDVDEDDDCGCDGIYKPSPGSPYYATLEDAATGGVCVTCGVNDWACDTTNATPCTQWTPQTGSPWCYQGDLTWDATNQTVTCEPVNSSCYSTKPDCDIGCVACYDYVICSENVCPRLGYIADTVTFGDCGAVDTSEWGMCRRENVNTCDIDTKVNWACKNAGGSFVNSCNSVSGDGVDMHTLYNSNDSFGVPFAENGVYKCDNSKRYGDPENCRTVREDVCRPACTGSAKDAPDLCWKCNSTGCCERSVKGRLTSNGLLVCPKGSYTEEKTCNDTCKHSCWECTSAKGGKSVEVPCRISCDSIGRWDTLREAMSNCDIESYTPKFNGYTQEVLDKVYRPDVIDAVFQRNYSNQNYAVQSSYTPIANIPKINTTIFNDYIHLGIRSTYDLNNNILQDFSDFPYNNLSNSNIENSLHKDLVKLLNEVKLATGSSIKNIVLNSIRNLIISDRVEIIDGVELKLSLQRILDKQSNYPDTRGTVSYRKGTLASEAQAIKLAVEKSYFFKNDTYGELAKERIKLWKTLAPDLNKNLPVRGKNGVVTPFYFAVDDTIILNGSGGPGTITLGDGDFIEVSSSTGGVKEIPAQGDYDRAKIIQLEDLQKIMYILGETYDFKMDVTTDPTLRVDERYGVADARKDFYMLKAEVSAITDKPRTNSFIAKTDVKYTYIDSEDARSEWVKFKPWPYMVFYVDWADPIISYIINGGTINITSKDFVFDIFDNEDMVVFPRRIPFTIVIIPTNKVDNIMTPSISKQSSYGVRTITFNIHPDPEKSDTWTPVYLKETRVWPDPGVEKTKKNDFFAVDYSMAPKQVEDSLRYQNDNVQPTIERPMFGMRQVLNKLKDFKDNWVLRNHNRDVMWYDVYDEMDRSKMKFLFTECVDWHNQKSLLSMGNISSDTTVNTNYPKVKDVKGDGQAITQNFFATHTVLESKPIANHIPSPDPLP